MFPQQWLQGGLTDHEQVWLEGRTGWVLIRIAYFDTCTTVIDTGLGKSEQGISTALAVEKTSKRGGKIINVAAEQG